MRFMGIVKSAENGASPPVELMIAIDHLAAEAASAGIRIEMGGLLPSAFGARIRLANGHLTVTDGPFTEAKEVVGGFATFNAGTKEARSREWGSFARAQWLAPT